MSIQIRGGSPFLDLCGIPDKDESPPLEKKSREDLIAIVKGLTYQTAAQAREIGSLRSDRDLWKKQAEFESKQREEYRRIIAASMPPFYNSYNDVPVRQPVELIDRLGHHWTHQHKMPEVCSRCRLFTDSPAAREPCLGPHEGAVP